MLRYRYQSGRSICVINDYFMTACMHLHVINEKKVHLMYASRGVKGLYPCEQHVSWHTGNTVLAVYHSPTSRGATKVARENPRWTLGINVGRSTGNPFTFRMPPGHFAGTFSRENDERDRKLRKDNGSCPIELPFAALRRQWRRDGTWKFSEKVRR